MHVRWFLHVDRTQQQAITDLLNKPEDLGCWPTASMKALIHLILKPAGDRRPIGLMHGLIKLWEGQQGRRLCVASSDGPHV